MINPAEWEILRIVVEGKKKVSGVSAELLR